jgi:hypothetical protein
MEAAQVVLALIDRFHSFEHALGVFAGVHPVSQRARRGVVFFVLDYDEAHRAVKIRAAQNTPIKNVGLESLQQSERAPHADAKCLDARLESLEIAALEYSNLRLFAPGLEFVNLNAFLFVGFEVVRSECQAFDSRTISSQMPP